MADNAALGILATLLAAPGFDAAQTGRLLDVVGLRPLNVTANCDAGQEMLILADATAGAIVVQLPPVDGRAGRVYFVKKTDSSANAVTPTTTGAETIDGATTCALTAQYAWVMIACDGLAWHIVSHKFAETTTGHVTNGNSHDHAGGDGAQIDHGGLGGLSDDDHTQYYNAARLADELPTFLAAPLTSTSWDGDNKGTANNGTIDLSTVFSAPAGIKAALVRVIVKDNATGDTRYVSLGPSETYFYALTCYVMVSDVYNQYQGVVPCDANGDFYVKLGGDNIDYVSIQIWGYWP